MNTTQARLERGISIVLFVLALIVLWQSARMPGGTLRLPGPGMLPMAIGALLALASLALIVMSFRPGPDQAEAVILGNRRIAGAFLAVVAAGFAFERLGFLLTGGLFLFAMLRLLSKLGWWRSAVAGFAAALVLELGFRLGLGVGLPLFPWTF